MRDDEAHAARLRTTLPFTPHRRVPVMRRRARIG